MIPGINTVCSVVFILAFTLMASGCSSKTVSVRFKVNTEPEGAHVVYQLAGAEDNRQDEWIYLGHTPLRGVRQLNEDHITSATKVTLKAMRAGYYDQIIEWDGEGFWAEAEEKGVIFWTPKLIANPADQ
jgi:hypothetical protein